MLYKKQPINTTLCISALMAAVSSKEQTHDIHTHSIEELIKFLQKDSSVSEEDLIKIEWAYLPILDRFRGGSPKLLENKLASDPEFFCEIVRLIYRSKNQDDAPYEPTEEQVAQATNAWRLFNEWRKPPGIQEDGSFDENHFSVWLQKVNEICSESGHLEVAYIRIGEILIHSPADPDGLWINRKVAEVLNDRETENMRTGYSTGVINSRGFNTVDPTGKPERELAEQFRQKAEEVENAGFQRFAVTLRGLAQNYDDDADRIISEHESDS